MPPPRQNERGVSCGAPKRASQETFAPYGGWFAPDDQKDLALKFFDEVRRLLGSKRSPAASGIREVLADAEAQLAKAMAERAKIEARRPEAVLAGEAERAGLHIQLANIVELEADLNSVILNLTERLHDAEAAEESARRQAGYRAASKARDHAAQAIREKYPTAAETILEILEAAAKADLLVDAANAALPEGAEILESVEIAARHAPYLPRQVVKSSEVELWSMPGSVTPLSEALAKTVQIEAQTGRGFLRDAYSVSMPDFDPATAHRHTGRRGETRTSVRYVERRKFIRREVLDPVVGATPEALRSIVLPGLTGGDAPYWLGLEWYAGASSILEELDVRAEDRRRTPATVKRVPRFEFELIETGDSKVSI